MQKNKGKLLKYLQSQELMSLATYNNKGPNTCIVYYGIDNDFNLYIITSPSTEHGKNIASNHMVACSITNTNQPMYNTKYKIGVQIKGIAQEITKPESMKVALQVWSKNRGDVVKKYIHNITNNIWKVRPYVIKPKEIKWFNEELYGDEGVEIFKF